jgi:hypothetical protein
MAGDGGAERGPASTQGDRGSFPRRRLLIGGGVVAGAAAVGWYGTALIGDGFERHVADVLGTDEELARALVERAREAFGGAFDWEAFQFVAATRFPGSELPAGIRGEAIEHMVEAMVGGPAGSAAYAGRITPDDLLSPCPGLGPI